MAESKLMVMAVVAVSFMADMTTSSKTYPINVTENSGVFITNWRQSSVTIYPDLGKTGNKEFQISFNFTAVRDTGVLFYGKTAVRDQAYLIALRNGSLLYLERCRYAYYDIDIPNRNGRTLSDGWSHSITFTLKKIGGANKRGVFEVDGFKDENGQTYSNNCQDITQIMLGDDNGTDIAKLRTPQNETAHFEGCISSVNMSWPMMKPPAYQNVLDCDPRRWIVLI